MFKFKYNSIEDDFQKIKKWINYIIIAKFDIMQGGIIMSANDGHYVKIEAGQIMNPESFPPPNELVCIQVPKVFDQVSVRDCETKTVTLKKCHEDNDEHEDRHKPTTFTLQAIDEFDIVEVKVISKTDSLLRPGFKKLKLFVKVKVVISFSDGEHDCTQVDFVGFNLTINEIYCPNCIAQIGVIHFPHDPETEDEDGLIIKVEALIEAFNEALNSTTGVLTYNLGAFFVVKCECIVQLLMPAYGYCPVPPEQANVSIQTCTIFNDKTKTPFPTSFFPDQKWNPLDSGSC